MALSKKTRFQLDVLSEFGLMPLFDGRAPDYLDSKKVTKERFGPWCRRVLKRDPDKVSIVSLREPDPKHSVVRLADDGVMEALRAIFQEHRKLGCEAKADKLDKQLALARYENDELRRQVKRLQDSKSEVAKEKDALKATVSKRSKASIATTRVKQCELLSGALLDFLEEDGRVLHDLVRSKVRMAAQYIGETEDLNAGLWELLEFVDARVRMADKSVKVA